MGSSNSPTITPLLIPAGTGQSTSVGGGPTQFTTLIAEPFVPPVQGGPTQYLTFIGEQRPPPAQGGPTQSVTIFDLTEPLPLGNNLFFGQQLVAEKSTGAGSSLTFTQQLALEILKDINQTFTFESLVNTFFAFGDNTLTFTQALNIELETSAGNTITFGSIGADAAIKESLGHTLTFAQVLLGGFIYERSVQNGITFVDIAFQKDFNFDPENAITFAQVVAPNVVLNLNVSNQFLMASEVKKCIEEIASNLITFASLVARGEDPDNTLSFGQTVVVEVTSTAGNTVTFGQQLAPNIDVTIPVGNTINFDNVVVGYVEERCDLHEYTPHRAPSSLIPASISLSSKDQITLDCSGSPQLVLKNPTFSNTADVDPDRVIARSRSGTIGVFRDSQWPDSIVLSFTVSDLKVAKRDEVETFLNFCLGKLVTLVDQECRTWTGVIINPTTAINELAKDRYSLTIEMSANAV